MTRRSLPPWLKPAIIGGGIGLGVLAPGCTGHTQRMTSSVMPATSLRAAVAISEPICARVPISEFSVFMSGPSVANNWTPEPVCFRDPINVFNADGDFDVDLVDWAVFQRRAAWDNWVCVLAADE